MVDVGGLLAEQSFELSYSVALLIAVTALLTALQFEEPQVQSQPQQNIGLVKTHLKNVLNF